MECWECTLTGACTGKDSALAFRALSDQTCFQRVCLPCAQRSSFMPKPSKRSLAQKSNGPMAAHVKRAKQLRTQLESGVDPDEQAELSRLDGRGAGTIKGCCIPSGPRSRLSDCALVCVAVSVVGAVGTHCSNPNPPCPACY